MQKWWKSSYTLIFLCLHVGVVCSKLWWGIRFSRNNIFLLKKLFLLQLCLNIWTNMGNLTLFQKIKMTQGWEKKVLYSPHLGVDVFGNFWIWVQQILTSNSSCVDVWFGSPLCHFLAFWGSPIRCLLTFWLFPLNWAPYPCAMGP